MGIAKNLGMGVIFMHKKNLMLQGTGSSVGKSLLTAAFCRILYQDGHRVAPFKSQNMALNSFITKDGMEMGRAQVVQAEAACLEPDVLMNPILLKPTSDKKCQVILQGKVHGNMSAVEYHTFKPKLLEMIRKDYENLADNKDIVVIEGAGSPAEINLRENDLVNMCMAEIADAPVIIVGDIDRGGVFASIYGTIMLLAKEERKRVKGVIINKFRGDIEILKSGLKMLEELIYVPVLGVIPYMKLQIEDEDSLAERFRTQKYKEKPLEVAVLYLPHVSNFTDFNVFETQEDVHLRYVMGKDAIGDPDILIIPGSKNTIEDLLVVKQNGWADEIQKLHGLGKLIIGICGGYQMLGRKIYDPNKTESDVVEIDGLGLLGVDTVFELEKTTAQVDAIISNGGSVYLKGTDGLIVKGYEIHMGNTTVSQDFANFSMITKSLNETVSKNDGCVNESGNVIGTYIHGIFDNIEFTRTILNNVRKIKGLDSIESEIKSFSEFKEKEYNRLADIVRENVDMDKIYAIINNKEIC